SPKKTNRVIPVQPVKRCDAWPSRLVRMKLAPMLTGVRIRPAKSASRRDRTSPASKSVRPQLAQETNTRPASHTRTNRTAYTRYVPTRERVTSARSLNSMVEPRGRVECPKGHYGVAREVTRLCSRVLANAARGRAQVPGP